MEVRIPLSLLVAIVLVLGFVGGFSVNYLLQGGSAVYYERGEQAGNFTYGVKNAAVAEELRSAWRETTSDGLETARCVTIDESGVLVKVETPDNLKRSVDSVGFSCGGGSNARLHTHPNRGCSASSGDFYAMGFFKEPYMIVGCAEERFNVYYWGELKSPSMVVFP